MVVTDDHEPLPAWAVDLDVAMKAGWSKRRIAAEVGASFSTVRDWRQRRYAPGRLRAAALARLAKAARSGEGFPALSGPIGRQPAVKLPTALAQAIAALADVPDGTRAATTARLRATLHAALALLG